MNKFTVRVGREFDVRETTDQNFSSLSNVTVHVTLSREKQEKKLHPLLMAAFVAAILVFSSGAFAVTYGYVTGDFSFLRTIAETLLQAAIGLAKGITQK